MTTKKDLDRFGVLLEAVFSAQMEQMGDQIAFTKKYQNLFRREYDEARQIVFSATSAKSLSDLMGIYLNTYGRHQSNPNLIHYYKSDQLYLFLLEQSSKVEDESLFESWARFIKATPDNLSANSFYKRYADLDPNFRRSVDIFIKQETERRRNRRSLLDVLRDEFQRVNKAKPTLADLYNFDPSTTTKGRIDGEVQVVVNRWLDARTKGTDDNLKRFADGLTAITDFFKQIGDKNLLSGFQAVKQLRLPSTVSILSEDREVLVHGLHAIACIQLYGCALRAKLYQRNLNGFTPEELAFFLEPVKQSKFLYKSNIINAVSGKIRNPGPPISAISETLKMFVLAKSHLPDLTLVDLDTALKIQTKWTAVRELTMSMQLAARNAGPGSAGIGDRGTRRRFAEGVAGVARAGASPARGSAPAASQLENIMKDPRNADAVQALREISSTKVYLDVGRAIGKGTVVAGTSLGRRGAAGVVSVVYIHPGDTNIFVEFSAFKPQLFRAPHFWAANQLEAKNITEIYESTIGIVNLTQIMFMVMGFIPVLIEAGFVGLIYEIAKTFATEALEEQLAKVVDPKIAAIISLAINVFAPGPEFKPTLKGGFAGEMEESLLSEKLNVKSADAAVENTAVNAETRGTGQLSDAETKAFLDRISVEDDVQTMHAGLPLTRKTFSEALAPFKPGYSRIPTEWKAVIAESGPVRKLCEAAWRDPEGEVKLVRITEKQGKALPFKYQKSSMGSDYELHVKLNGRTYKFDGVLNHDGGWWIGESKFTFKDMLDEAMASLGKGGKADPTGSWHFAAVEKAIKQFEDYSAVAKRFGFEGVAVYTNTEFLWATFEQTTRHIDNVKFVLSRLEDELPEFAKYRTRATAR